MIGWKEVVLENMKTFGAQKGTGVRHCFVYICVCCIYIYIYIYIYIHRERERERER